MRFAPRAGLAWAPSADGNSAVRAGVGLFYTQIPHRLFSDALRLDGRHGQRFVVDRPEFFPGVPDARPGVPDVDRHDSDAVTGPDPADDARLNRQLRSPAGR